MSQTHVTRMIDAPVEQVFDTIAHIEKFKEAIPDIVETEFLSETTSGVGTRFLETRLMRGKKVSVELEVTEYAENERVRIVSDTHGTVWDTVFTVNSEGDQTRLDMVMDARAHKLLPKLLNPLTMGMIQKALERDMDAVKAHCEGQA